METVDYVATIPLRVILSLLIFFSFFLLLYGAIANLVGLLVAQQGALYCHGTCLYIWNKIAKKNLANSTSQLEDGLVPATGGADV